MKVLFVCAQNRLRSPTAARVFASWPGIEVLSAGVDGDAVVPVSAALLAWADLVLCMERWQRIEMVKRWPAEIAGKRIVPLDIDDDYDLMQPELVTVLQERVPVYLPARGFYTAE